MIESRKELGCPVCEQRMQKVVEFKDYPLTEIYESYNEHEFGNTGFVDQGLLFCQRCSFGKLETIISKDFLYNNYRTTTAISVGSMHAIDNFYSFVVENVRLNDIECIVDIGANDATLLTRFCDQGKQLVAIDPNANRDVEQTHGIQVFDDFFENVDLQELRAPRKLFLSSHTLEHIEQPLGVLGKLREMMGRDDLCVFQFPSLDLLLRDARFDQVHHQHVNYFSERSIALLLGKIGFDVVKTYFDSDHYGTLMVIFKVGSGKSNGDYGKNIDCNMDAVNLRVELSERGVVAYGAALMLPLLAYNLPALERIECIVDDDTTKAGLRFINFNKEIVPTAQCSFKEKDVIISAISTKLALRKILEKLFRLQVENIILPLNMI
jgi:hypothetical protein